jgi:MarR family transcriptional regulator for hemolysin
MSSNLDHRRADEEALLRAFGPLRQGLRRAYDRELAALGLSITQMHPLTLLHEHGPMRQGELAQRLEVEGPTLVRLLDQMEAAGLVARHPDPDDQRAKVIHPTDVGTAMTERALPVVAAMRVALLADVPDDELATCVNVLRRLAAALEQDVSSAPR